MAAGPRPRRLGGAVSLSDAFGAMAFVAGAAVLAAVRSSHGHRAAPADRDPSDPAARSGAGPRRPRRRRGGAHRRRRRRRWLWPAVTVVSVLGAGAILANIALFYRHSDQVGGRLRAAEAARVRAARAALAPRPPAGRPLGDAAARPATAPRTAAAVCPPPPTRPGQVGGLLDAPAIGLDAPVVQGDGDAELAVAVGHVPASAWPGRSGTVVLEAHDVTWFSRVDHLGPGSALDFVTPCWTYHYRVTGHEVVPRGQPIYDTAAPRVVLVTCYPLNALYLTPDRYLVTAALSSVTGGDGRTAPARAPATVGPAAGGSGALPTSLPAAVAARVAPRVTTTAPFGQLLLSGKPSAAWRQSPAPINAADSALLLYFGAIEVAERTPAAWPSVAPGVAATGVAPLLDASISAVPGAVTPTLVVAGDTVTSATVTSTVDVAGGLRPGRYRVSMTAAVRAGRLVVTGWQMVPW